MNWKSKDVCFKLKNYFSRHRRLGKVNFEKAKLIFSVIILLGKCISSSKTLFFVSGWEKVQKTIFYVISE